MNEETSAFESEHLPLLIRLGPLTIRFCYWASTICGIVGASSLVLQHFVHRMTDNPRAAACGPWLWVAFISAVVVRISLEGLWYQTSHALSEIHGPASIGPLAEAHWVTLSEEDLGEVGDLAALGIIGHALNFLLKPSSVDLAPRLREALIRELPTLSSDNATDVSASGRASLRKFITPEFARRFPYLAVAVVQAIDRIGDADARPLIDALANQEAVGWEENKIRTAAQKTQALHR